MSHDVDAKLVRKLAKLLEETGLGELEYATDDWRIRVARSQAPAVAVAAPPPVAIPAAAAPAPVPVAEEAPAESHPGAIKSPMVGTVYVASDPDAPAFVNVGDKVTAGQTVLIVEAMKVMNPITAPKAGTVTQVLVSNGQPVEYDQVLMVVE